MASASNSKITALIDKSWLSHYVSGETAFDSYAGDAGQGVSFSSTYWQSAVGTTTGHISFDLGAAYPINGMALFGINSGGIRVNAIKVYADTDSDFTNGHSGLLFETSNMVAPRNTPWGAMAPNVFSFDTSATTRYLTLQIVGNAGGTQSALGEVVFSQAVTAVPEPGTYALMGLGLLTVGLARRKAAVQR